MKTIQICREHQRLPQIRSEIAKKKLLNTVITLTDILALTAYQICAILRNIVNFEVIDITVVDFSGTFCRDCREFYGI